MKRIIKLKLDRDLTEDEASMLETLIGETLDDWGMKEYSVEVGYKCPKCI